MARTPSARPRARLTAWQAWAALALGMASPAWAAVYTFPGALPVACVSTGSGTYSCTTVTLAAADTVNVVGSADVSVTGNLDIKGSQKQVNREKMRLRYRAIWDAV